MKCFVEIIEDRRTAGQPFVVVLGARRHAYEERLDPCRLPASNLLVLEIYVMD